MPKARLHVVDSSVLFSALGNVPATPGAPPIQGTGRRMMWYADMAAFRAGYVYDSLWNKSNIGLYSFAAGNSPKASGYSSTAFGTSTIASGNYATAFGLQSIASGTNSTAMGLFTIASEVAATAIGYYTSASNYGATAIGQETAASGIASTALGNNTVASGLSATALGNYSTASGQYSFAAGGGAWAEGISTTALGNASIAKGNYATAIGDVVKANAYGSISLGSNNDTIVGVSNSWILTEPLLIVGNGSGSLDKKNALVILKNGNHGIGTNNPKSRLHVKDGSVLFSAAGDIPESPESPPIEGPGRRMMWYADKAAFRAGYMVYTIWDQDSIGNYSFASGSNTRATGNYSSAFGSGSVAKGTYSFASGVQSKATGNSSVAFGAQSWALGNSSTAFGYFTTASANLSFASGNATTASGHASTAMGEHSIANGPSSTAIGDYNTAKGLSTTALGRYSSAIGDLTIVAGHGLLANAYLSTSLGSWNDTITGVTNSWILTDPLLIVGNGPTSINRNNALVILKNGLIGMGLNNPLGTLDVMKVAAASSTAIFRGTTHSSNFNYGTNEDTYIRAGKNDGFVILNDISGGYVGIGTSSPNAPLGFPSSLGKKITLYPGETGDIGFAVEDNEFLMYADHSDAAIRLGYDQAGVFQYNLDIFGNGNATLRGTLTQNSDIRLKKNVVPLQHSLEKIALLNGYHYYWKNQNADTSLQTGVIAQEVQSLFPELVSTDAGGMLSVNYSGLIPVLIESTKDLKRQTEDLQRQVDELKKQNEAILSLLEQTISKNRD